MKIASTKSFHVMMLRHRNYAGLSQRYVIRQLKKKKRKKNRDIYYTLLTIEETAPIDKGEVVISAQCSNEPHELTLTDHHLLSLQNPRLTRTTSTRAAQPPTTRTYRASPMKLR